MEFEISKKIKVAFICQFSSEVVQERLPIWKESDVYAAWITNTIEGFKNSKEFELHIISPHQFLKKDFSYEEEGIFYHFYKIGIPIIGRNWPRFFRFDLYTNFYFNRKKIKRIVSKIKPDIINLQGAENAHYSYSVLDLYKKYPVLVTIQGFVGLEISTSDDLSRQIRVKTETKIINTCNYFGGDLDSKRLIQEMRSTDFKYYNYYYPNGVEIDKFNDKTSTKEIDLLFWGRTIRDKGAEDFLFLVAKLIVDFPNLMACMIGPVAPKYLQFLKDKSIQLGCEKNICFKGFINSSEELYKDVLKSKILVLPTYNDRFPTVLREAVCLKIAVIGYSTGSIPQFNIGDERILLANQGDIEKLYTFSKKLLLDKQYFNLLTQRAYNHGVEEFSILNNCARMGAAYKDILKIKN